MARKNLNEVQEKSGRGNNLALLSELVEKWGSKKKMLDPLSKDVKSYGDEIKNIMVKEQIDESRSGDFVACLSFQTKEEVNEEGIIEYLKNNVKNAGKYIKKVEVLDWDAIENAMYNQTITKEQMLEIDKFRTVKKTPVLKMGK